MAERRVRVGVGDARGTDGILRAARVLDASVDVGMVADELILTSAEHEPEALEFMARIALLNERLRLKAASTRARIMAELLA